MIIIKVTKEQNRIRKKGRQAISIYRQISIYTNDTTYNNRRRMRWEEGARQSEEECGSERND